MKTGTEKRGWRPLYRGLDYAVADGDGNGGRPWLKEVASSSSDLTAGWIGSGSRPLTDYVLSRKRGSTGFGSDDYALLREILHKNPSAQADLQTRINGVTKLGWRVEPASDEARDVEIAEFVEGAIQEITGWEEDRRQLLKAVWFGWSVLEVMWDADGKKVLPVELRERKQGRFAYDRNDTLLLREGYSVDGKPVPDRKFVVHRFDPEYENPYGTSLGARCWWWFWFKQQDVRFWLAYLEQFGNPTKVGKYPPGATAEQKDDLFAALKAMQNESVVVVPEAMVVELLEARNRGGMSDQEHFVQYCDRQVTLILLGQTLSVMEHQGTGTYAQASVHADVKQEYVEADAKSFDETMNSSLVWWVTDYNFGPQERYPKFKTVVDRGLDLARVVEAAVTGNTNGLNILLENGVATVNEVRMELGLDPLGEVKGDLSQRRQGAEKKEEEEEDPRRTRRGTKRYEVFAEDGEEEKRKREEYEYLEGAGLRARGEAVLDFARRIVEAARRAESVDEVRGLSVPREWEEELAGALMGVVGPARLLPLAQLWRVVEEEKKMEEKRGGPFEKGLPSRSPTKLLGDAAHRTKFEDGDLYDIRVGAMEWEEAVEYFSRLVPRRAEEIAAVLPQVREQVFALAGYESDRQVGIVKEELGRVLKDGGTLRDFQRGLEERFDREGLTRRNSYSVERIFRTETHRAYAQAQRGWLRDPEVSWAFPMADWVTAGDDRVRDAHAAHERGGPYPLEHAVWGHLGDVGCRCQQVPRTRSQLRRRGIEI